MRGFALIVEKLVIAECKARQIMADKFYTDVGEKLTNVKLDRLKDKLTEIASIHNVDQAKKRWIENKQWDKDFRAFMVALGFFSERQKFLPMAVSELENIFKKTPDILNTPKQANKWLPLVTNAANEFVKSIDSWEDAVLENSKENFIQKEFNFFGYKIKNHAALTDEELKPYLDIIKKGTKFIDSKLAYGTIRITTSKEVHETNGEKYLAVYIASSDTMNLLVDRSPIDAVKTFIHEMGHRLWSKFISRNIRTDVYRLFKNNQENIVDSVSVKAAFADVMFNGAGGGNYKAFIDRFPRAKEVVQEKVTQLEEWIDKFTDESYILASDNGLELEEKELIKKSISAVLVFSNAKYLTNGLLNLYQKDEKFPKKLEEWSKIKHKIFTSNELTNLIVESESGEKNLFPSVYSKSSVEEFFAENYAYYKLGKPISQSMETILKAW